MKLKMNYLVLTILLLSFGKVEASCPEFNAALEQSMLRATSRENPREAPRETPRETSSTPTPAPGNWSSREANSYKNLHRNENRGRSDNRVFMSQMAQDNNVGSSNILYFDVENAVQKKLNDTLVADKGMVDAINNSFMTKFHTALNADKELVSRLQGQYQDFKSMRLRLALRPGDNASDFEKRLSDVYRKANKDFVEEFESAGLTKLISPRTDEVVDVSTWFLSGTGQTALEANMATRGARAAGFTQGTARSISFNTQVAKMFDDVNSIERIRKNLASQEALLRSGVMVKIQSGEIIPSKDMIGILRKIKLADCQSVAEYNAKIRAKVQTLFGSNISDKNITDLTTYFSKVDSISPPLFQRDRVTIDYAEANNGIVSVDFAGIGVDNAYEQMKALSAVNYAQSNKSEMLRDAFTKIQSNVDNVTAEMNGAKRAFTNSTNDPTPVKYSGDDGILMPNKNWDMEKKQDLIKRLAASGDPGKYRVTFVRTEYSSGATIPGTARSQFVVRAESVEKSIREAVVGARKIPSERARKMIFAIDSRPSSNGIKYDLIIGGEKPTADELKMIREAFNKSMNRQDGETSELIVEAFN